MTLPVWVSLSLAGAIGAPLRYVVDAAVQQRTRGVFPWGTLAVNACGSFVLGLLGGFVLYHDLAVSWQIVFGSGLCGAFTTFSTFSYETVRLLQSGATGAAARNVVLTLATGATAAAFGLALVS
jgi:CrcB protein